MLAYDQAPVGACLLRAACCTVRADTDNREGWAGQWICLGGGGLNELAVGVQVRGGTWTKCLYARVVRRLRPRGAEVSGAANRWIKLTTIGCVAVPRR
jgi:hypothetical protein